MVSSRVSRPGSWHGWIAAGRLLQGVFLSLALLPVGAGLAAAPDDVLLEHGQRFQPVWSSGGMVAGQEPLASAAGASMLRAGGNAVDAAVAAAFVESVTLPQAGNLGGGGFLLLWLPGPSPARLRGCLAGAASAAELEVGNGHAVGIDFRERAPLAANRQLFLAPDGSVDRQRATRSLASSGVPGSVAGLVLAHACYGRLSLERVMAPAIAFAREGFVLGRDLSDQLQQAAELLALDPESRRIYQLRRAPQGAPQGALLAPPPGTRLRQPELASTLQRIAATGAAGFYSGPVAGALLKLMEQRQGLIRAQDLRDYRAQLVRPLLIRFRGHPVLSLPPPAGGLSLLQALRLLDPLDLAPGGSGSARALHLLVETLNLVFRERNARLGDPERQAIPVEWLLSEPHLADLRQQIDPRRHTPSSQRSAPAQGPLEGGNTTHLSATDRQGGLVALTTSLNLPFGNGISIPGTGVLLNNTMDDFTAKAGSANAFGLRQGERNAIAPRARPLSSMAPTLVFRPEGQPWLALGSPGGSRITSSVLQVLLNRLVHGLNLASAVSEPRLHSQLWPDVIGFEQGLSPDTQRQLEAMGHALAPARAMGATNAVEQLASPPSEPRGSLGVSDPRRSAGPAMGE
ncbi:MAG: gamma-glutamyltransferase [Synechococcaceae cyanobacterium]|nr:gamma-glutamyltransferase [Synechococcaceae cyanobacterium]